MVGSLSSLVGEIPVCYSALASYCSSSVDGFLVLDGEVDEGSTLAGSSTIEMSIFGYPITSSCSPESKSFLELSF